MSNPGEIHTSARSSRKGGRALLWLVCAWLAVAAPVHADRGKNHDQGARREAHREGRDDGGAARAAAAAQGRHGGKVLKVSPQGGSYNVRLLLPDGTVKSVTVDTGD